METNNSQDWINQIFMDPTVSKWLKQGMTSALKRDPVDVLNDARTLAEILRIRWEEMRVSGKHGSN